MIITVRVYFNDGDTLITEINGDLETAKKYYIGRAFNLGSLTDEDYTATAVDVELFVPRYCIQCTDIISGKVGDFLYEKTPRGLMATSPVFNDLAALFTYLKEKGITNAKGPGAA